MNRIENLTVKGFRALKCFSVEGLGRVNLITGRNNSGKSSVLEALRLLASSASASVILGIIRYREESPIDLDDVRGRLEEAENRFLFSSLFSGFPQLQDEPQPIVIQSPGTQPLLDLTLRITFVRDQPSLFRELEEEGLPTLVIESRDGSRGIPLDYPSRSFRSRVYGPDLGEGSIQCVYVSPYGGERTANLGALWDNIALSDSEQDVVAALHIIDPEISAVSMVGGESPRLARRAIVRSANFPRPIPLRSFGDGLNRLFGIVLSLVNAQGGLLLIDEFENGMHHSVQLDAWRAIFRLAQKLEVQVFATSHSWDAIDAFQKAAAEAPAEGVLMRLSRKEDYVIPTLFREQELAVVTRDGIEVR